MIAFKELLPIVVALAIWDNTYRGRVILCHCDNAAVVSQDSRLHAHDPQASHMLRCLAYGHCTIAKGDTFTRVQLTDFRIGH